MRITILTLALLACASSAYAQERSCQELLVEANQLYTRGAFDETIVLLDQCIALPSVTEQQRRTAYRLKGLCFIGKGLEVDARESVRRLLTLVPDYEPDPAMDPPSFVTLIQEVRQELNQELTTPDPPSQAIANDQEPANERETQTEQPQPATQPVVRRTSSRRGVGRYVLIGVGAGAVGGLAYLLLNSGDSGGGEPIADPPALPQ